MRQFLDEREQMIGERSDRGISPLSEGKTYLPVQTHVQPGNAGSDEHNDSNMEGETSLGVGIDKMVGKRWLVEKNN